MDRDLLDKLLLSIDSGRLSILCGAGLSMPPPTNLPSAAQLAQICCHEIESVTGSALPEGCEWDLERLAEHMLALNRFRDLLNFVPWGMFRRKPNSGHTAIADMLVCGALRSAISTNYDSHIEDAAYELGEQAFTPALDGAEANDDSPNHHPLLKLHGCCWRDRVNTLWANSQLGTNGTIQTRVASGAQWLQGDLAGRDIIVVGFWSDWAYLNEVLEGAVAATEPRTVVLVDPEDPARLQEKAPGLWRWASAEGAEFIHVCESGASFLNELRTAFSRNFLNRVFRRGVDVATEIFGLDAAVYEIPEQTSTDTLYSLRKDLSGCSSQNAPRIHRPTDDMALPAAFITALVHLGATLDGAVFQMPTAAVRVLNTPNRRLSELQDEFGQDFGPEFTCDTALCIGAIDDGVPSDLVRSAEGSSVVRGGWDGEWLTTETARARFGL